MRRVVFGGTLILLLLTDVRPAEAIPAFARRYRVSCQLCHNPIPRLTAFGDAFAGNGFRMSSREAPRDTVDTGDPDLQLLRDFPLAARLDAYAQWYANGRAATDFETPYGLKILSGGAISSSISWYFYSYLAERGEIGGVEDATLIFDDLGGAPVDVSVGQFQVSDPLFKRELRLMFEDYAVYRARLGEVPVDLTYDRGVMASADVAGLSLTAQVVNGNGIGEAGDDRRFDNDGFKNIFLHATREFGDLRLGVFGYRGNTRSEGVGNGTRMYGVDGTLTLGPVELNGQFVHRRDDHPTFEAGERAARLDGGFLELLVVPPESRWHAFALYNRVSADRPLLDVRLGGAANVRRYETVSAGIGRQLQRNIRWVTEGHWDFQEEVLRWTVGFVSAF